MVKNSQFPTANRPNWGWKGTRFRQSTSPWCSVWIKVGEVRSTKSTCTMNKVHGTRDKASYGWHARALSFRSPHFFGEVCLYLPPNHPYKNVSPVLLLPAKSENDQFTLASKFFVRTLIWLLLAIMTSRLLSCYYCYYYYYRNNYLCRSKFKKGAIM